MNLFKKIIIAALLFVGNNICSAQEISFRGGFNLSQFQFKIGDIVSHREGTKPNPGFNLGPIIDIPLQNIFSVETGILFTSKGNKISGNPLQGVKNYLFQKNTFYLDFPILLKATIPINKIKVFAMTGGYVGSALYGNSIARGEENLVIKHFKNKIEWGNKPNEYDRVDYGLKFGAGIKVRKYQIGAFYEIGLKDFSNDMMYELRNRVLEFYIAYQVKEFKKVEK
jgi:hypothetical protein